MQAESYAELQKDCETSEKMYKKFGEETYWLFDQSFTGELDEVIDSVRKVQEKISLLNEIEVRQIKTFRADFKKKYGGKGEDINAMTDRMEEIILKDTSVRRRGEPAHKFIPEHAYFSSFFSPETKSGIVNDLIAVFDGNADGFS